MSNYVEQAINRYTDAYVPVERPTWEEYFLGLCFFVAERSEDANTHHGCILTNRENHIIGTGYNGFPKGGTPGLMPNTRPDKYKFIIHAEENALLNTTVDPASIPLGAIAYITGRPCLRCLYRLHNKNIRKLVVADTGYDFKDYQSEESDFNAFVQDRGIEVEVVRPHLTWLRNPIDRLRSVDMC